MSQRQRYNILIVADRLYDEYLGLVTKYSDILHKRIPSKNLNFQFCKNLEQFKKEEDNLCYKQNPLKLVCMVNCNKEQIEVLNYIMEQNIENRNLDMIHSFSVGVDKFLPIIEDQITKINAQKSEKPPLFVTNAKGSFSESLAEFVIYACLFHAKKTPLFLENQENKNWVNKVPIRMIKNKNVAIIGYGNIGYSVANYCKMMGMNVTGIKRNPNEIEAKYKEAVQSIVGMDQIDNVLRQSDYVVNILPLTSETKNLYNLDKFQKMKANSVFINIGRGGSVVEQDLIKALNSNIIAGATLDVFQKEPVDKESELWHTKNLQMTYHCGDVTDDMNELSYNTFTKNLELFFKNQQMENVVDLKKGY